jgi:hypothetical protein
MLLKRSGDDVEMLPLIEMLGVSEGAVVSTPGDAPALWAGQSLSYVAYARHRVLARDLWRERHNTFTQY